MVGSRYPSGGTSDDVGFLTIALMPFTYSITIGIGAGFVSWMVITVFLGKSREVAFGVK